MLTEEAHTPLIIRLPIHSPAFVIMPGGFGTLDGAFEVMTLVQDGQA